MSEENKSPYQEGSFQLNRLNALQEKINLVNLNLLAFDEDIQEYNYKIKLDCLNTLFSEVAPRILDKEKKSPERCQKAINDFLSWRFPHRLQSVNKGGLIKKEIALHKKDFELLKDALYSYELIIRELLHKYFRSSLDEGNKPKDY